jgi:hypothetical protein
MNANNVNPASIAAQALAEVASKHGTPARPPIANGKFRPVADFRTHGSGHSITSNGVARPIPFIARIAPKAMRWRSAKRTYE